MGNNISFYTGMGLSNQNMQTDMFGRKQRNAAAGPASILTGKFDPIEQKRELARKRALKIVSDAFSGEKKIDDDIKARMDLIQRYESMVGEANRGLGEIDERMETLREEYGVDPDSQEQKDLEILAEYRRVSKRNPEKLEILIPQEKLERARTLYAQGNAEGYTEYQKRALELDKGKDPYLDQLEEAKKGLIEENAAIRGIQKERLKYHPILDAVQQADKVMENAGNEIKGMLLDEAVDHIDEKSEEEFEKAEEKKEEKKEEEERIEQIKERREELEALANPDQAQKEHKRAEEDTDPMYGDVLTEAILKMDGIKNDEKQEVSDMITKMKIAAEDLKGLKVDEMI